MKSTPQISVCFWVCMLFFNSAIFAQDIEELKTMSLEDLMNLKVITASKIEQKESEAPSIVTVITTDDIQKMGATCLEDVLRIVPGFDTMARAELPVLDISVRGLPYGKVKFLLNGYELTNFMQGNPIYYINAFPLDLIQRIEIIRGPGSALYGTHAFNAVIQIFTKNGTESSKANIEGGSYNSISPSIEYAINKKNVQAYVYADYRYTDGPAEIIEEDYTTHAFPPGLSSAPGYTTNSTKGSYFAIHSTFHKFTLDVFATQIKVMAPVGALFALVNDDELTTNAYNIGLSYDTAFNKENGLFSFKGFHYYNKIRPIYEWFTEDISEKVFGYPPGYKMLTSPVYHMRRTGYETYVQYNLIPALNIMAGTSFEIQSQYDIEHYATFNMFTYDLNFDGTVYPPNAPLGKMRNTSSQANWNVGATRKIFAAFAQGSWDIKKTMGLEKLHSAALTFGVRFDKYNDVGETVNPRAGLVIEPTDKFYIKGLYGNAFYAPEPVMLHSINSPVENINPDLKPEDIDTYELMVGSYLTKSLALTVSGFKSRVTNKIQFARLKGEVKGSYLNIGELIARGVETELKMRLPGGHYGFFNMAYQKAKDLSHMTVTNDSISFEQDHYEPGLVPTFIMNLGGNYVVTPNINLNMNLNYINARKRSEEKGYDANGNILQIDQRDDLDPRLLVNGAVTIGNFSFMPKLKLKLTGKNLLNADYRDPVPSGNVPNDLPRYGREFMAKLMYGF